MLLFVELLLAMFISGVAGCGKEGEDDAEDDELTTPSDFVCGIEISSLNATGVWEFVAVAAGGCTRSLFEPVVVDDETLFPLMKVLAATESGRFLQSKHLH